MVNEKLKPISDVAINAFLEDIKNPRCLEGELCAVFAMPRITLNHNEYLSGFLRQKFTNISKNKDSKKYLEFISENNVINELIILADKENEHALFKGICDRNGNIYRIYGVEFNGLLRDSEDIYYEKINSK